jgi:hypothetical protein
VSLADAQRSLRQAVVEGRCLEGLPPLVGGRYPHARLAIHQRHYQASLVSALRSRFSATEWLIGSPPLIEAARGFVREHPPAAPCIAEYGAAFPAWLTAAPIARRVPFLGDFAELDWQLGRVSTETDRSPLPFDALKRLPPDALTDVALRLQTGLHYLRSPWPVDEVMTLYVTQTEPGQEPLQPAAVRLEVRGARGSFRCTRLDEGEFQFRSALHRGDTLGAAAARAMEADEQFDPGRALAALFTVALPVAVAPAEGDGR